jgi:predicted ATP-dependent serine protease
VERIRWTCNSCGAVHHYIPMKCGRCGKKGASRRKSRTHKSQDSKENEQKQATFDTLMEELDKW